MKKNPKEVEWKVEKYYFRSDDQITSTSFGMAKITLFSQVIGKLPKEIIKRIIRTAGTDKHCKGYNTWSQFVGMVFCQFSQCDSVRDISDGLKSATGNLNHLGISRAPSKSTVAYQNAHRDSGVFRNIFYALYLYLDERLRVEEEADYLAKADDPDNDHYSMESYAGHALRFGTIALLHTKDASAEDIYYGYKSRGEVEQAIDAFKNTLEADTSYMRSTQALEAWMFINIVALHWYYELRQRLIDTGLIKKYSPADMIRMLQRLRTVYVDGQWRTAELTKKEAADIAALGVDIT